MSYHAFFMFRIMADYGAGGKIPRGNVPCGMRALPKVTCGG